MSKTTIDYGIKLPHDFLSGSHYYDDADIPEVEYHDINSVPHNEQLLWKSVIIQAILDATSAPLNTKARMEKTQAIIWLSPHNKDFLMVCELAGADPLYVILHAKKTIKKSSVVNRRRANIRKVKNKQKLEKIRAEAG